MFILRAESSSREIPIIFSPRGQALIPPGWSVGGDSPGVWTTPPMWTVLYFFHPGVGFDSPVCPVNSSRQARTVTILSFERSAAQSRRVGRAGSRQAFDPERFDMITVELVGEFIP